MILLDFSNITHRMIFAAIANAEKSGDIKKLPKGEKHDMQKLKPFFLHLLFNNLKYVKETFSAHDEEEIFLCLDSSSWRKDYYPLYKSQRAGMRDDTNVDWPEFYKVVNALVETIIEAFPFKVVKVDKAEGDDIIAVIAKHFHTHERILMITEDKDYKQLLEYPNVQLYRPIYKQFIQLNKEELKQWRIEHILGGDASDGIPTIKTDTEFTPEFITYLKEKLNPLDGFEIPQVNQVYWFNQLPNAKELLEGYNGVDKYGKNNTYKAAGFGEKSIQKFVKDGILKELKKNKMFAINFKRNRHLIQFKYIPEEIEKNILDEFNNVKLNQNNYNSNLILEFFTENNLKQLSTHIDVFCPGSNNTMHNSMSLEDWF